VREVPNETSIYTSARFELGKGDGLPPQGAVEGKNERIWGERAKVETLAAAMGKKRAVNPNPGDEWSLGRCAGL